MKKLVLINNEFCIINSTWDKKKKRLNSCHDCRYFCNKNTCTNFKVKQSIQFQPNQSQIFKLQSH